LDNTLFDFTLGLLLNLKTFFHSFDEFVIEKASC